MGIVLTALAFLLLALGLWCFLAPELTPVEAPAPELIEEDSPFAAPRERLTLLAERDAELAKFQLRFHLARLASAVCNECNGTRLVWTDDPSRPSAKLGICRRCGAVRFDAAHGQVLAL